LDPSVEVLHHVVLRSLIKATDATPGRPEDETKHK
jgi:hypothetical protein